MKTYTSKIYIRPNTLADERLCVGLFAFSEGKSYFKFSERKLRWLKSELGAELIGNLRHNLNNISAELVRLNSLELFSEAESRRMFSEGAFNYLHVYGAGLLHFEKFSPNALSLNDFTFNKLYENFVDAGKPGLKNKDKVRFRSTFKARIRKPDFEVLDIDYNLGPSLIPGIYTPHKIDFIGKNGALLAGTAIDFKTEASNIERKLLEFEAIARGLNAFSTRHKMKSGKYLCFFNDPESKEAKSILDIARKNSSKPFELKEFNYLDVLSPELKKHSYSRFSDFIEGGP